MQCDFCGKVTTSPCLREKVADNCKDYYKQHIEHMQPTPLEVVQEELDTLTEGIEVLEVNENITDNNDEAEVDVDNEEAPKKKGRKKKEE